MSSVFKHVGCGGDLSLNIANMFTLKTPSMGISPKGITVGVVELESKRSKNAPDFCCEKCSESFPVKEIKQIEIFCLVCRQNKPANSSWTSYEIGSLCESCKNALENPRSTSVPDNIKRTLSYISIPPKGIKFISFREILEMKLEF